MDGWRNEWKNDFRSFQNLTFFTYLDLSRNHLTAEALTEEVFYGRYHGNKGKDVCFYIEFSTFAVCF